VFFKFILLDFYVAIGETLLVMNVDSYDTSSPMFMMLCHTVLQFSSRNICNVEFCTTFHNENILLT
jgi:hypothetical protein